MPLAKLPAYDPANTPVLANPVATLSTGQNNKRTTALFSRGFTCTAFARPLALSERHCAGGQRSGAKHQPLAGVIYTGAVEVQGRPLLLNGAGIRQKTVFKVYTAGLYLAGRTARRLEAERSPAGQTRLTLPGGGHSRETPKPTPQTFTAALFHRRQARCVTRIHKV